MAAVNGRTQTLADDLRALPVPPGRAVFVQASMRRLGFGGPEVLLAALRSVIGPEATVVVYTATAGNSLSSPAFHAATAGLDASGLAAYVDSMNGFDAMTTPSEGMGAFAEHVRTRPEARRSSHPQTSFAAVGPAAADLLSDHDLGCHLGDRSPLGALYWADALVLLLGTGYATCTTFHLAEYRLGRDRRRSYTCFEMVEGVRVRRDFEALDLDDRDFAALGHAIEPDLAEFSTGRVGNADARIFSLRAAVDSAVVWLTDHRPVGPGNAE